MLFKALLTKLAGGQSVSVGNGRRTRSAKTIYERFPSLSETVIWLLRKGENLRGSQETSSLDHLTTKLVEVIYPAMEILEKIGMPPSSREHIVPQLVFQLESPISGVREKAARILCGELDGETITEDINWLLEPPRASQNALHGWLLCLKFKVAGFAEQYRGEKHLLSLYPSLTSLQADV